jgi:hypothetical protein
MFILMLSPIFFGMAYSAVVAIGAVKIQNLESREWGFVSGSMVCLPINSGGFIMVTSIIIEFLLGMLLDDRDYIYFVETMWTAIICLGGLAVGGLVIATLLQKKVVDGFEYKAE